MKILHRYLTFQEHPGLTNLLAKLEVKYTVTEKTYGSGVSSYSLEFYLYENDPRFSARQESLKAFDIRADVGTEYEEEDILNAEWFWVVSGGSQYPQPEDGFKYEEITFDLENHCRICGIGKVQKAPFQLKKEPAQKNNNFFWGIQWEHNAIFARQETKNILERENISGISFSKPHICRKGQEMKESCQLHIHTVLPAGFDSYNAGKVTCKPKNEEYDPHNKEWPAESYCGRIKYHHPKRGGYTFDKRIFENAPDIVMTNEYFGSGGSVMRLPLFSKKVKELIEKHKLKGLVFTPIVHKRFE